MNLLIVASLCAFSPQDPPQQPRRIEPLPIPRSVIVRRGERNIAIDGSLQDWPSVPSIRLDDLRQLSGSSLGAFRGRGDIAGRVFLLWDADYLYVGAQVEDDWHVRLLEDSPRVTEIPPADSLVLTFDPERDTRALGHDEGRAEDAEFWLADVEGQGRKVVRWDRFRGTARFARDSVAAVSRDDEAKVTVHEARIAWSEILQFGHVPKTGQVLDLQVVLSDYDEPTDPIPQTRVGWTFGMGTRIDPGLLGSVMLLGIEADEIEGSVHMPEIGPPPSIPEPAVPPRRYWIELLEGLKRTHPVFVDADTDDPATALGTDRRDALFDLDRQVEAFPRVDYIEFQNRIQRRMNRECEGIAASGLPFFWDHALGDLGRRAGAEPPERGFRIFRLPQSGWLVRSTEASFAIDPAGYGIEKQIWGAVDFVMLTDPRDFTKRNDQLLVRMAAAKPKRPVILHRSINLPGLASEEFPLVVPGQTYERSGLRIRVLGQVDSRGYVSPKVGYQVTWPDGTVLVVSGRELYEETVDQERPIDLLLLSARHPSPKIVGQRLRPRNTVLDEVLECATLPGTGGRASLEDALELQRQLRPHRSTILGPGESLDVRGGE